MSRARQFIDAKGKEVTLKGSVKVDGAIKNVDAVVTIDADQATKDAVKVVNDADEKKAELEQKVGTELKKVKESYKVASDTENTNAAKAAAVVDLVKEDVDVKVVNVDVKYVDPNIVVTLTSKEDATVYKTKNITVTITEPETETTAEKEFGKLTLPTGAIESSVYDEGTKETIAKEIKKAITGEVADGYNVTVTVTEVAEEAGEEDSKTKEVTYTVTVSKGEDEYVVEKQKVNIKAKA